MEPSKNKQLIDALNKCVAKCNHCTTACLGEQDISMLVKCIELDIDCADICALTSGLIARGSKYSAYLLKACAEICTACATECDKHAHMEHCKLCAEACRKCAKECSQPQDSL